MNTAVNTNQFNYRFKLTDYSLFDRNRARRVAIYGRVSTEHEAQLSALDNQLQWYDDQVRYHPNWDVVAKYIDMYNRILIQCPPHRSVEKWLKQRLSADLNYLPKAFFFVS